MYDAIMFLFDVRKEGWIAEVGLTAGANERPIFSLIERTFLHS